MGSHKKKNERVAAKKRKYIKGKRTICKYYLDRTIMRWKIQGEACHRFRTDWTYHPVECEICSWSFKNT